MNYFQSFSWLSVSLDLRVKVVHKVIIGNGSRFVLQDSGGVVLHADLLVLGVSAVQEVSVCC